VHAEQRFETTTTSPLVAGEILAATETAGEMAGRRNQRRNAQLRRQFIDYTNVDTGELSSRPGS
jgi:hypothetical protein